MNKHTPAPWVKRDSEIIGPFQSNKHICDITGNFMSAEEKEANAKLIAAAPILLKTLEWVSDNCEASADEIWAKVEKAIKQAT